MTQRRSEMTPASSNDITKQWHVAHHIMPLRRFFPPEWPPDDVIVNILLEEGTLLEVHLLLQSMLDATTLK